MGRTMDCLVAATFLAVLSMFSSTVDASWKSCDDSGRGKVLNVTVGGCGTEPICPLKKGTNATIAVGFQMNEDSKTAKAVVHGIVEHIPVPFPPENPDGCKDSGLKCPLSKGTTYVYRTSIFIKSSYPSIRLVVKWELQDDNSKDIFCVLIPVVLSGSQSTQNQIL